MWFENLPQGRDGALRLFCFPYAGGSAQVFRGWQRHFAPQAALSLAHLPGRAARVGEPPFKQYKPLVNALADAIVPQLTSAFAFWGHSMGTLISFELARELRRRGKPAPLALFLSGRGAPQIPDPDPPVFNLPDPEFIAELRRLNGTPRELLDSPELKEFFLPTIERILNWWRRMSMNRRATYLCYPRLWRIAGYKCAYDKLLESVAETNFRTVQGRTITGDHFYIHTSTISARAPA